MKRRYLFVFLSLGVLSIQAEERPIRFDGSTGVMPLVKVVLEDFPAPSAVGQGMNTSERIDALLDGMIDIAMASHGIDRDRFEREGLVVHRFSRMAVVFAVHESVPLRNLSDQEICDIYSGKITNWSEIGGPDLAIVPLCRPDSEVDAEVVLERVEGFSDIELTDTVQFHEKSGALADALATTPGAIGMTTVVRVSQNDSIVSISLNEVMPTVKNVERGDYTLTRNAYLITRGEPIEAITRTLKFFYSDAAKQIMLANDAIPTGEAP